MRKVLLIIIVGLPLLLTAQDYTLSQLIDSAMQNNISIKRASLSLESSRARLGSARINYLPDISAGVSHTQSFDNIMFENPENTDRANFSISKTFALNNDDYYSNKIAKQDLTAEEISFEIEKQRTLYSLIQKYIEVLELQKQAVLQQEYIQIQLTTLAERNILFQQKKITQYELQQSEIEILNTRIDSLDTMNSINKSRRDLFDIVNITDDGHPLSELDLYTEDADQPFTREVDYNKILAVKQQNEVVNRARTSITRTRFDFFPNLTLRYNYGRNFTGENFTYSNASTDHTISLNINYSLNTLLKNRYQYKQVKYLQQQNMLNTDQLYKNIAQQYDQLITDLNLLQQMQTMLERRYSQTTVNLNTAQQRYRLGYLNQNDYDTARYDNNAARMRMESNVYRIALKKLEIDNLLSNNFINK